MNDSPNGLKANGRQAAPENGTTRPRKSAAVVILLCFVAIVFDGYDLVVYGAVLPTFLQPNGLAEGVTIDKGTGGLLGSYALFGVLVGARIGRSR